MIRLATTADIPRLLDLEAILFENSLSEGTLVRELAAGACFVIGTPVHAYALTREQAGLMDLLRLGVLPTEQGRGLGKQLLEHVLALGFPTMLTVRKNNPHALRLYRRAGFTIVGELHAEGTTGWVMQRSATSDAG